MARSTTKSKGIPMSNKSRRRVNASRRRLSMAAGALLAGAAIPVAAAGSAWADELIVPVVPVAGAGAASIEQPSAPVAGPAAAAVLAAPTPVPTLEQLEAWGLSPTQGQAVLDANTNGVAVQVSYDGKVV